MHDFNIFSIIIGNRRISYKAFILSLYGDFHDYCIGMILIFEVMDGPIVSKAFILSLYGDLRHFCYNGHLAKMANRNRRLALLLW